VIILTPGNVADCTVGPECVSLVAGIKKLLGDKAYDSGVVWRLAVEPVETAADRGRAFRILLEGWDAAGKPLLRLETFKLGLATN
jgi:hypothetical protein